MVVWGSYNILLNVPSFNKFVTVFTDRFNNANRQEGGAVSSAINRTFGYAFNVLDTDLPLWGYGEGYCTNVGIKTIHGVVGVASMSDKVLVKRLEDSEMEWSRIITERGILMGLVLIFIRIAFGIEFLKKSRKLLKRRYVMAWIFLPPAFVFITTLPLKVPTNLTFMFLAGALVIAAFREPAFTSNSRIITGKL